MPTLVSVGEDTGRTKTYESEIRCPTCNGTLSSLEDNCPKCGNVRQVMPEDEDIKETKHALEGEELAKVKGGAHPCKYCETLTWNYEEKEKGYVCDHCGAGTGKKTDFELAGGKVTKPVPPPVPQIPQVGTLSANPEPGFPLWGKISAGVLALALVIWLIVSLVTTHDVGGKVTSVEWSRSAHQTENQLLDGQGFELPYAATMVGTPEPKFYSNQSNVVGQTHGTYFVTSTPKVVGHTHGTYFVDSTPEVISTEYAEIDIETPGAYYFGPDYDCGSPTKEAGGSVTYRQCHDRYQYDSTFGKGKSAPTKVYAPVVKVEFTTEPTNEYAPVVDVERTTMPTPVYGTPTPIYKDYYIYKYWSWMDTGPLPTTSGRDNKAFWPSVSTLSYCAMLAGVIVYLIASLANGSCKWSPGL